RHKRPSVLHWNDVDLQERGRSQSTGHLQDWLRPENVELIEGVAECPLLALSGHHDPADPCPLSGVKRTSAEGVPMSAFDPKRTSATRICRDAQCSPQHGRVRASV